MADGGNGQLEMRALGPIDVVRGERRVEIGGPVARRVFAVLLAHRGAVVASDTLCEVVWGDRQPATAHRTLQSHVSRLRAALAPEVTIEGRAPGYALHTDAAIVDIDVFDHLVEQGHDVATPVRARMLARAVALWRGPPFGEFADDEWATAERARLEESHVRALEALIEARMATADVALVVADLERLVVEHPLRERFWRQLVLALYRAGRRPEALRRIGALRDMLRDELGLDPSPEARRLETQILLDDPELIAGAVRLSAVTVTAARPAFLAPGDSPFVGRDDASAVLETAWRAACRGEPQLVVVEGDPGVGKTRLVVECFTGGLGDALVLGGQCDDLAPAPFHPLREAIGTLLRGVPHQVAEQLLYGCGALVRIVPELASFAASVDGDRSATQRDAFDAFVRFVRNLAAIGPVALVVDDLQWADPGTLLLLRHLARRLDTANVCAVVTLRSGEAPPLLGRVLGELAASPAVVRIHLSGLDRGATSRLVALLAPDRFDETDVSAVHELTNGHPFFIEQVVRQRMLERPDRTPPSLPETVREVVAQRVAVISPPTTRLLGLAAVAGRRFDLDVLAQGAGVDLGAVLAHLDEACAAAVVREDTDGFTFAHELVRTALVEAMSEPRRAYLHRCVADAVETVHATELDAHAADLARHWESAGRLHRARAAHYALLAAEAALEHVAYDDARRYADQARASLPERALEQQWRAAQVLAAVAAGVADGRASLCLVLEAAALARSLGDPARFARSACLVRPREVHPADADAVTDLLAEAVAGLPTGAHGERARALAVEAAHRIAAHRIDEPIEDIQRQLTEALAMAARLGDVSLERDILHLVANASSGLPNAAAHLSLADRMDVLDGGLLRSYAVRCEALLRLGRRAECDALLADIGMTQNLLSPEELAWYRFILGCPRFVESDFDGALAAGTEARALRPRLGSLAAAHADRMMRIAWLRGDLDAVDAQLARMAASSVEVPQVDVLRALRLVERGDEAAACALARQMLDPQVTQLPWNGARPRLLHDLAEIAGLTMDRALARALRAHLAPYHGEMLCSYLITVDGAAATSLAIVEHVLGDDQAAFAHFAAGLQLEAGVGGTMLAETTRVWRQWALGELGEPDAAELRGLDRPRRLAVTLARAGA